MTDKVIAVIPARGGSKRIPRKNIVDFEGKPLLAWTVQAALDSGCFDKIVVSTDDPEFADIAIQHGAEVPFLRDGLSGDHDRVSDATIHTLNQIEAAGESFDTVVQLFSVCPLRTAAEILEALNTFTREERQFQLSCFRYVGANPWWAVKLDASGHPTPVFEAFGARSQDLPELYCPTGAIWIARVNSLREAGTFYGPDHVFHEIDWISAIDIDTMEDLKLASALRHVRDGSTPEE